MAEIIIENSTMSCLYFETYNENEVPIGVTSQNIGEIVSVIGTTVTTDGSVDLTTVLSSGMAVKLLGTAINDSDDEIRRVDYVESSTVFNITRECLYTTHVGQDVYIDFWSNSNYGSHNLGGIIERDNFQNTLELSDSTASLITFDKCTEFTGLNSIFLFNSTVDLIDREESFVTGTYDITTGDENNLIGQYIIKPNVRTSYILNMENTGILELDDNAQVVISSLNPYIYKVTCNGTILNASQYSITGNITSATVTITDSTIVQVYSNYISILHYPRQDTITGHSVRFKIQYFDEALMLDANKITMLNFFKWYEDLSSQSSPEFYEYRNKETKQNELIRINQNNKISFTVKMGIDTESTKNIVKHINLYLKSNKNFRLIRYVQDTDKYEYYWDCRKADGTNFNEDLTANTYNYSISYLRKSTLSPHTWGDVEFKWGEFDWGLLTIVED